MRLPRTDAGDSRCRREGVESEEAVNVVIPSPYPLAEREPFAHMTGHARDPRAEPCSDCAVTTGYYKRYTILLKRETPERQVEISRRWTCHQTPGLACAGACRIADKTKQQFHKDCSK